MRFTRKLVRLLIATAVGLSMVAGASTLSASSATAAPDLLPLNVTNNSNRGDQVYLYLLGTNLNTGRLGYVNSAGTFTPWSGGSNPPSPAPDVAINGPGGGGTTTLQVPRGMSGRVYMSFGQKLKFFLTPDGLVQPAPWAAGDANRDILFDWSEFTYDLGGSLFLNSSQVDMFSVPHAVAVTGASGATTQTGELVSGGREGVFNAVRDQPGDWSKLIYTRSDGTRLRVLAPGKGLDAGLFSASYFDGYLNTVWDTYRNTTLTVVPFEAEPNTKFFGRTGTDNVLRFTNSAGATVASFQKPSTRDVFGCDGALQAPNDPIVGPISRTLCAALHRSTLGYQHTQPTYDASQFYAREITDHYSAKIHKHMVDGKAYGFAFDDVGHFESLVHDGNPSSARITLTPF